ncbi:MAG TPA: TMEM175 family protein [Aestuariivirgaceae bacterium]
MSKERLAAFSDGVIAIIITIMVLELKVPHGDDWSALAKLWPVFLSYVLSFAYIAIYWNNHHHLLHTFKHVNGSILWANTHLLFWLSLIPFATGWMGENNFAKLPTAVYGAALLLPAVAYYVLQLAIIKSEGLSSVLAKAIGNDVKGKISPVLYIAAIGLAFFKPWISCVIYGFVALMWFIPDRRIEKILSS